MNMEAVKGFLAPLGLNTSSIQDTLVCILRSFPTLVKVFSCISQKLVVIGGTVETARRASISAWNGFVDCSYFFFKAIWLAEA
jgi:chaperone BCS1